MVRLNLNNCTSTTEEHHQAGHPPVPSEWGNNKCYTSSEQEKDFLFLDGQRRTKTQGRGRTLDPALHRMGEFPQLKEEGRAGRNCSCDYAGGDSALSENLPWRTKQGGQSPEPMQRIARREGGKGNGEPCFEDLRAVQSLPLKPTLRTLCLCLDSERIKKRNVCLA